jgi:hypothetical protein
LREPGRVVDALAGHRGEEAAPLYLADLRDFTPTTASADHIAGAPLAKSWLNQPATYTS